MMWKAPFIALSFFVLVLFDRFDGMGSGRWFGSWRRQLLVTLAAWVIFEGIERLYAK